MISAITDGCSVRYAQLDSKIYKFQSLVFKEGKFNNFVLFDVSLEYVIWQKLSDENSRFPHLALKQ